MACENFLSLTINSVAFPLLPRQISMQVLCPDRDKAGDKLGNKWDLVEFTRWMQVYSPCLTI